MEELSLEIASGSKRKLVTFDHGHQWRVVPRNLMRTVFFLVLFVFAVSLPFHRQSPLESLLFAISLAVGLTPEFLPMITTVTLAQGASHMAKHKVIVKNLAAIQNFGSMDILCSDKTGTLTSGNTVLH